MTTRRLPLFLPVGFVAVFLVLPFLNAIATFFSASTTRDVLTNPSMLRILWFSLWQAVLSVLVTMIFAIPATWALSRFQFPGARLFRGLLTTPFVLPSIVVAAGVLPLLGAASAKWGFKGFDNHNPRAWLAEQTGARARARAQLSHSVSHSLSQVHSLILSQGHPAPSA
jgi:ABC-type Fe3+ transport system permease subunit